MKKFKIFIILFFIIIGIKGYLDRPVFSDKPTILFFLDTDEQITQNTKKILSTLKPQQNFDLIIHQTDLDQNKTTSLLQLQMFRYPISAVIATGSIPEVILPTTSKNNLLTLNTHPFHLDKNIFVEKYINFFPTIQEEVEFLASYIKTKHRQIIIFYPTENQEIYQIFNSIYSDKKHKIIQTEKYDQHSVKALVKHALYYHPKVLVVIGDKNQSSLILNELNKSNYVGQIYTTSSIAHIKTIEKYPTISTQILFPLLDIPDELKSFEYPTEVGIYEYLIILNQLTTSNQSITKENILKALPKRELKIFTTDEEKIIKLEDKYPEELKLNKRK